MKNKFNTATFLRQLALTLIAVMLTATAAWAQGLSGTGTDFDPYLITSKDDWNTFASQVSGGNTSYSGKYFALTADISVNVMVGTKTNPFSGTFDGRGHTLTVDLENTEDYTAPFRYVNGATFRNLHTEGNINISTRWASGLISHAEGDVKISSCWSSVTIKSTTVGDGTHAGFIAFFEPENNGSITIENSIFDGTFDGNETIKWGGIVGWSNSQATFTNCLFAPKGINVGDETKETEKSGTFIRKNPYTNNITPVFTKCYYTQQLGEEKQGIDASSVEDLVSALGDKFVVKDNKVVLKLTKGSGTASDPYIISSTDDWMKFANDVNGGYSYSGKTVKLTANLAGISSTVGVADGEGNLRNPFSGTFDGGGHTINVNIEDNAKQGAAPFRYINGATIKNLTVTGTVSSTKDYASGLVGFANGNNTIEKCIVSATIEGSNTATGVFLGWGNDEATATITNCLYLVAEGQNPGNLDLAQCAPGATVSFQDCYKTTDAGSYGTRVYPTVEEVPEGIPYLVVAADYNTYYATITQKEAAALWNVKDETTGSSAEKPYIITSPEGLYLLATKVNAGNDYSGKFFRLNADITYQYKDALDNADSKETNFVAIGKSGNPFNGTFDGNGKNIKGIRINNTSDCQGLFGYLGSNANVHDVNLAEAKISGKYNVGGIAGYNYYGTISNCTSSATVSSSGEYYSSYGGIAGYNYGTISYCTSSATVSSSGKNCVNYGGIAGYNFGGTISNCTSSATVSSSGDGCCRYGGIAGENYGTISNCTSSATVSSSGDGCETYGGIAGSNSSNSTISNCTSSATVSSSGDNCFDYGGIAGSNSNNGTISNCTSINATVECTTDYVGAIVGNNDGKLSHNYYYNCTVNENDNATQVGCNGDDIQKNDGAVRAENKVSITAADGITIKPVANILTDNDIFYSLTGVSVVLGIDKVPADGYVQRYTYAEGKYLTYVGDGKYTFTVPNSNVSVQKQGELSNVWGIKDENTGSSAENPYIITSPEGLDLLATEVNAGKSYKDKFFRLDADITYQYNDVWNNANSKENNFIAIGNDDNPFQGTFNGNGKTISGIRIYNDVSGYQGLFGYIGADGKVQKVILTDARISAGAYNVGGIAGRSYGGEISNCIVGENVAINGNYNGGIVGYSQSKMIGNLAIGVQLYSEYCNGAIIGDGDEGYSGENNYYYNCSVNGSAISIGGSEWSGIMPAHIITAAKSISIKSASDKILSYSGDYYTTENTVVQVSVPGYETIKPTVTDIDGDEVEVAQDADGNYIFTMPDKDVAVSIGEGEGTEENPYIIKTPDDLRNLAKNVNDGNPDYADKHFLLVNDLDMSGVLYVPIGKSKETPFSGIFDGGGNTISNINMTGSDENNDQLFYGGIFGYCANSTIKNVTLDNSTINVDGFCGGIVGDGNGTSTLENCHVTANVSISSNGRSGGIAGENTNVYGCTSAATVYGYLSAGGINGDYDNVKCTISNCLYLGTSVSGGYPGSITSYIYWDVTLSNNFYTHYGLGGIGTSESNMYCHDEEGAAQYALTSTTQPAKIGNSGESYDEKAGITPYEHGLYYNGLYYFAPDLIIDGNSNNSVVISKQQDNQTVVFHRTFTEGIFTTIILPFDFTAAAFGNDEFYTFTGVDEKTWEATMTKVAPKSEDNVVHLNANTPYIFKPSAETAAKSEFVFTNVTIKPTTGEHTTKVGVWEFHGTYEKKLWNTDDELETKNVYGFAATSETNREGKAIAAGEFVRAGYNVSIKPTRAYLEYKGTDDRLISKSALELPDCIKVVFIDKETASVIDDPTVNPSENEDSDIETPTSEIQPTANVKVWSYDKTIYIQARPGTDYRIIDANGRLLRTSTTQTDRDEIHLGGKADGIVIVNIGGKSFKIRY